MIQGIMLDRKIRNYGEILDVCEYLSEEYGSACNALAAVTRRSPMYQATINDPQFQQWVASGDEVNETETPTEKGTKCQPPPKAMSNAKTASKP